MDRINKTLHYHIADFKKKHQVSIIKNPLQGCICPVICKGPLCPSSWLTQNSTLDLGEGYALYLCCQILVRQGYLFSTYYALALFLALKV